MNTDQILFKKLDEHSGLLRKVASEFADLLNTKPVLPEMRQLTTALLKLQSSPIDQIDKAIMNTKLALDVLNIKIQENKNLLQSLSLESFLNKNTELVDAVSDLEKKAAELDRICQDQ